MNVLFSPIAESGTDHDVAIFESDGSELGRLSAEPTDVVVTGGARLASESVVATLVDPHHRREGVLTGMVRTVADEARDRGQVLLVVDRPACSVYERFGFGVATETQRAEVHTAGAEPVSGTAETTHLEPLLLDKIPVELPSVFVRCTDDLVGAVGRTTATWHRLAHDASSRPGTQVLVHRDSTSMVDGYVVVDIDTGSGRRDGHLLDLIASSEALERQLWQHLVAELGVERVLAEHRPLDDVARWAIADTRAYQISGRRDATWLRILDLDVALGARTYGTTIANVVVQVEDPWYHANCGTWRIDSYGSYRSQARPDLQAGISEMSSVYLGAVSWVELRDAGRIVERRAGAAYEADALFAHRPYPFTPPASYR